MNIRFLHSNSGDWVGLYVDKELLMEGHQLPLDQVLRILFPLADIKSVYDTGKDLEAYGGYCPPFWTDELENKK